MKTRACLRVAVAAAATLGLFACAHGGGGATGAADKARPSTVSPPVARPAGSGSERADQQRALTVFYYKGSSKVALPGGRVVGGEKMVVRRTVSPGQSQIEEYVVTSSGRSKKGYEEYRVIMKVTGNSFVMKEAGGAFTGKGTLVGEPWKWTSWRSESVLPNKMIVESKDALVEGKLLVHKTMKSPDGTVRVLMTETLVPIAESEFHRAKAEITKSGNVGAKSPARP